MELVPYNEKSDDGHFIRTFDVNTPSEELKWHFDDENRIIIPIQSNGWKIQIDESLPEDLVDGKEYFIPIDVYHRVIKGHSNLEIKLYKLDSIKGGQPKYVRKYTDNPNFSDYLLHHFHNGIPLHENLFRYGSDAWCDLIQEAKELYEKEMLELDIDELELIENNSGKIIYKDGQRYVLNTPFVNSDKSSKFQYFVYICDEKNEIKKIDFNAE